MAAASFSSSSTSGLNRRSLRNNAEPHPPKPDQLRPIIDPPPKAKLVFQVLAFVLIVFLACLQFLPATHLRDPTDPHRSWIPVDGRQSRVKSKTSTISKNNATEFKTVHLVSWIDCLDLRVHQFHSYNLKTTNTFDLKLTQEMMGSPSKNTRSQTIERSIRSPNLLEKRSKEYEDRSTEKKEQS